MVFDDGDEPMSTNCSKGRTISPCKRRRGRCEQIERKSRRGKVPRLHVDDTKLNDKLTVTTNRRSRQNRACGGLQWRRLGFLVAAARFGAIGEKREGLGAAARLI
jgi:hypothetical protein